ncbi:MAG: hypothetical protein B6244_01255 [Candidatus Cloacimonetes bacterium 4572_55]|nr:MAG: hypothetical protein B6244_01255 [Candidatus Cloacimonetes bacterium 4572_55]
MILKSKIVLFTIFFGINICIILFQIYNHFQWPDFHPSQQLTKKARFLLPHSELLPLVHKTSQQLIEEIKQHDLISYKLIQQNRPLSSTWSADSSRAVLIMETSPFGKNRGVLSWDRNRFEARWLPISVPKIPIVSPDGKYLLYLVATKKKDLFPHEIKRFDLEKFENKSLFRSAGKSYSTGFIDLITWLDHDLVLFIGTKGAGSLKQGESEAERFIGVFSISKREIGIVKEEFIETETDSMDQKHF